MSIRLRTVDGILVALCAVETELKADDIYLDDAQHYALAAKFAHDWRGQIINWEHPEEWKRMESQKRRDAKEDITKWLANK